jgi:beta-barrel assembly-enhancing protease
MSFFNVSEREDSRHLCRLFLARGALAISTMTRTSIQSRPLIVAALILSLGGISGCAAIGLGGFNLISIQDEWQMGQQIEREINSQVPLSRNTAMNNQVTRIGQRIVAQTDMATLPWRFYVIDQGDVNAFNAPGGLVYINRGLIEAARNEAEIAGVIAHEIGHGVARHGTRRLSQQYGMAIVAGLVLGQDPGLLSQIATAIIAGGAQAQFSQRDEYEADRLGIRFMAAANYDPRGLVNFFRTLQEMQQRQPGSVERFFATHPPTPDRIERAEAEIRRIGR